MSKDKVQRVETTGKGAAKGAKVTMEASDNKETHQSTSSQVIREKP